MRYAVLLGVSVALLLGSCAGGQEAVDVLSQPVDTTVQHQVEATRQLHAGRIKFKGPVTFQFGGTGNQASATDAGKAKAPVAAGPGAVASAPVTSTGPPWYVYLGLVAGSVLVGVLAGAYLRGKFSFLKFLA